MVLLPSCIGCPNPIVQRNIRLASLRPSLPTKALMVGSPSVHMLPTILECCTHLPDAQLSSSVLKFTRPLNHSVS